MAILTEGIQLSLICHIQRTSPATSRMRGLRVRSRDRKSLLAVVMVLVAEAITGIALIADLHVPSARVITEESIVDVKNQLTATSQLRRACA